jgi:hypothetical protein
MGELIIFGVIMFSIIVCVGVSFCITVLATDSYNIDAFVLFVVSFFSVSLLIIVFFAYIFFNYDYKIDNRSNYKIIATVGAINNSGILVKTNELTVYPISNNVIKKSIVLSCQDKNLLDKLTTVMIKQQIVEIDVSQYILKSANYGNNDIITDVKISNLNVNN